MNSLHQNFGRLLAATLLCAVLTACGSSDPAPTPPGGITVQPADTTVIAGADAVFTIATAAPATLQWQFSADAGAHWADIVGATSASYTAAATSTSMNGYRYRAKVGAEFSAVAVLSVQWTPTIAAQPANAAVTAPAAAGFQVGASGNPAPTYQWQVSSDGGASFADIGGATAATYTLAATAPADDGKRFRARVGNTLGTVFSQAATLGVSAAAPSLDLQALAAVYTALRVGAALGDLSAAAGGITPCSSGSVNVDTVLHVATFTNCVTAFDPGTALSGSLNGGGSMWSTTLSYGGTFAGGTVAISTPLAAVATVSSAQVGGQTMVIGGVPQQVVALNGMTMQIGSHSYLLGVYTIGSPAPMTRTASGGTVTTVITSTAGAVTLDGSLQVTMSLNGPITWVGAGHPTSGSLLLTSSTQLSLQVQFLPGGQFRMTDPLTGLPTTTMNWTDPDVQAALAYVVQ